MSATEILVILFGLYVGYWVVSKLFTGDSKQQSQSNPDQQPKSETSKDSDNPSPTWHEILNVSPHATVDEIRNSYKELLHQYHPDKVAALGDELKALAERKSKEITSAYRQAMQLREVNS